MWRSVEHGGNIEGNTAVHISALKEFGTDNSVPELVIEVAVTLTVL